MTSGNYDIELMPPSRWPFNVSSATEGRELNVEIYASVAVLSSSLMRRCTTLTTPLACVILPYNLD